MWGLDHIFKFNGVSRNYQYHYLKFTTYKAIDLLQICAKDAIWITYEIVMIIERCTPIYSPKYDQGINLIIFVCQTLDSMK